MRRDRRLLVFTTIGGIALVCSAGSARADEIDTCANAYESAQRHHKSGELKASISEAQTCARDVCPEILKKDCSQWVTTWRAEEKEKDRERAAKEPPPETKPSPAPPSSSSSPSAEEPSRPVPVITYVLGGVGVLALGGATGFMLDGIAVRGRLDDSRCSPACDEADVDRARTSFLVADILGVAGIAAIGGAVVFYLTRPEVNAQTGSVAIIPSAGGASLRATF